MNCPVCRAYSLRTINSTKNLPARNIRQVVCSMCGASFTTQEDIIKTSIVEGLYLKEPDKQIKMFGEDKNKK